MVQSTVSLLTLLSHHASHPLQTAIRAQQLARIRLALLTMHITGGAHGQGQAKDLSLALRTSLPVPQSEKGAQEQVLTLHSGRGSRFEWCCPVHAFDLHTIGSIELMHGCSQQTSILLSSTRLHATCQVHGPMLFCIAELEQPITFVEVLSALLHIVLDKQVKVVEYRTIFSRH